MAWGPMAVLLLPVVLESSASKPQAVLSKPVVVENIAWNPTAVFSRPGVLERNACVPTPVLAVPVKMSVGWFEKSASKPTATLSLSQAVLELLKDWVNRALLPTATLRFAVVLFRSA